MLDCSRNAVFTVEKVKSVIRTLAKMGMNVLMLYTEDTYEVPGEPYFGSYRGRYTKAEIQEMDAYASMFGIELVPCIQTLAHLHNALKWPGKNEIKDSTDVLIVGKEETYTFIEELLQSVKEAFSTRRVHLGMDEAVLLGLGKYLKENGYEKGSVQNIPFPDFHMYLYLNDAAPGSALYNNGLALYRQSELDFPPVLQ